MIERPKLWNRGYARASIIGHEPTMNPTPAATSILNKTYGKKRVGRAVKKLKKQRRSAHKGNPLPAAVGTIASLIPGGGLAAKALGLIGIKTGSPRYGDAPGPRPLVTTVQGFLDRVKAGDATAVQKLHELATSPAEKGRLAWAQVWNRELPALGGSIPVKLQQLIRVLDPTATMGGTGPVAASTTTQLLNVLGQPGTIRALASAATPRRGRQARGRYPTYTDRYGRQRYSTRPPEAGEMRLPAGATPSPGTPYSFFQGAVGKGGAAATAGQLAVAAGAGIAAYLVTQKLLAALGGRAQKAEEAGVAAAFALRQARADLVKQQGHPITPAQAHEMGAAYKAQLVQLGYDPVTFTRTRSGVENFLETYNPFGG